MILMHNVLNDNNYNETYIFESVNVEIESKQWLYSCNMDKWQKEDWPAWICVSFLQYIFLYSTARIADF
jgi:hypothetical protein